MSAPVVVTCDVETGHNATTVVASPPAPVSSIPHLRHPATLCADAAPCSLSIGSLSWWISLWNSRSRIDNAHNSTSSSETSANNRLPSQESMRYPFSLPDFTGHGVEAPAKYTLFPYYKDKAIHAEYQRFLDLQMMQEGNTASVLSVIAWIFGNCMRFISAIMVGLPMTSWIWWASVATGIFSIIIGLVYFLTFSLDALFPDLSKFELTKLRNYFLRSGVIVFNISNCLDLANRSIKSFCSYEDDTYCAAPNKLPTPLVITLLCVYFYALLLQKQLTYPITVILCLMNTAALICCSVIVAEGSRKWNVVIGLTTSSIIIFLSSYWIYFQYMKSFEYYRAYAKSVQSEMDRATEMARHEREHLRMVLANVAHDLKTPLQAFDAGIHTIRSLVDNRATISNNSDNDSAFHEVLDELSASCVFMSMQINRALDVSKIENNFRLIPKYEPVNVQSVVNWAVNVMNCVQSRVNIKVSFLEITKSLRQIVTDKVWLQENLLCLLSNAVKYSEDGSSVKIQISTAPAPPTTTTSVNIGVESRIAASNLLLVEVIDSGIGVPEDRRDCLFKPFSQTQRRAGGTGLGLYSLALRVRELGGSYGMRPNVDAVSGKEVDGSVFYFTIPCVEDLSASPSESSYRSDASLSSDDIAVEVVPDTQDTKRAFELRPIRAQNDKLIVRKAFSSSRIETTRSASPIIQLDDVAKSIRKVVDVDVNKPLVLVVDDAPTSLKVMERALVQMGADVHTATNGFVALKMMKSQLYTLVIMDIQMPVMDGFESVRQLRAWERGPGGDGRHQYIIGASASPDEGTRRDALDVHMDEFGVKPLDFNEIVRRMRSNFIRS